MSGTPETTNLLLMWLVIVTAITPLLMIGAAIAAIVAIKRVRAKVDRVEQDLAPILQEARNALQQVQHITASVRRRVDEVDRGVTSLQHKTARLSDSVRGAMGGTLGRVLAAMGSAIEPRSSSRRAS